MAVVLQVFLSALCVVTVLVLLEAQQNEQGTKLDMRLVNLFAFPYPSLNKISRITFQWAKARIPFGTHNCRSSALLSPLGYRVPHIVRLKLRFLFQHAPRLR